MSLKLQRALSRLVDDVGRALADYARWPTVPARIEAVDLELSYLREALRGHDKIIIHSIVLHLVTEFLHDINLREIPFTGLRPGFNKIADLVDQQPEEKRVAK
jgi:hypothetical protein